MSFFVESGGNEKGKLPKLYPNMIARLFLDVEPNLL